MDEQKQAAWEQHVKEFGEPEPGYYVVNEAFFYHGYDAGRASRDADVERLRRRIKELEAYWRAVEGAMT